MNKKVKTKISTLFMLVVLLAQTLTPVVTVFAEDTTMSTQTGSEVQSISESTSQVEVGQGETTTSNTIPVVPNTTPPSTTPPSTTVSSEVSASTEVSSESPTSESQEVAATEESTEEDEEPAQSSKESSESTAGSTEKIEALTDVKRKARLVPENIITGFKITDRAGNEASPSNPLDPNSPEGVRVTFEWELPEDHDVVDGDSYIFKMPDVFAIESEMTGDLSKDGISYGTYTITKEGEVTLLFNSNVGQDKVFGNVQVETWVDITKLENETIKTFKNPIKDNDQDYVMYFEPNNGKLINKGGTIDKGFQGLFATWNVDINTGLEKLVNPSISDKIPQGMTYVPKSVIVTILSVGLDGTVTETEAQLDSNKYDVEGNLNITFKDLSEKESYQAYRVSYQTSIDNSESLEETQTWTNEATLTNNNTTTDPVSSSVSSNYGEELKKSTPEYNDKDQTFNWEVFYNLGGKSIEQAHASIKDTWDPAGSMTLGDFAVYSIELDTEGNVKTDSKKRVDPSEYQLTPKADHSGFELIFNSDVTHPYVIEYETKLIQNKGDIITVGGEVTNKVTSGTGKESGSSGTFTQQGIIKTSPGYDVNQKTIDWEIKINQNNYQMDNLILEDTFVGDGLTLKEDTFKLISSSGTTLKRDQDYRFKVTAPTPGNPGGFTVAFINDYVTTNESFTLSYQTDFERNSDGSATYKNSAGIKWKEGTTDYSANTPEIDGTPEGYTGPNGVKSGNFNPITKEITWEINTNYARLDLTDKDYKIEDELDLSQVYVADSLEVYTYTIDSAGKITSTTIITDGYELTPPTASNQNKIIVTFDKTARGKETIGIRFKTKFKNDFINKDKIENTATVVSGNNRYDLKAETTTIREGDNFANKSGKQNGNRINWTIELNPTASTVSNFMLTDTVAKVGEPYSILIPGSIKVNKATITESNGKYILTPGDEVPKESGIFTFEDTSVSATGEQSFTLKFNSEINEPYILTYETLIEATGKHTITNSYKISGDNISTETEQDVTEVPVKMSGSSGSGQGTVGSLQIVKKEADGTVAPITGDVAEEASFELWNAAGDVLIRKAIHLDANGTLTFANVRSSQYRLVEVTPPKGYTINSAYAKRGGNDKGQLIDLKTLVSDAVHKFEVEDPRFKVILQKKSESGASLEGAIFDLYDKSTNELVTEYQNLTIEDGELVLKIDPRHIGSIIELDKEYYVKEKKGVDGYLLNTQASEPFKFELNSNGTQTVPTVTITNYQGSVKWKKIDHSNSGIGLKGAEFEALKIASDGTKTPTGKSGISDADGLVVIKGLEPGKYVLSEVNAPKDYIRNPTYSKEFTIETEYEGEPESEDLTESPLINYQGQAKMKKTKADGKEALEGAIFGVKNQETGLYYNGVNSKGGELSWVTKEKIGDKGKFTSDSKGIVTSPYLGLGNYEFVELTAPTGYIRNTKPVKFTIQVENDVATSGNLPTVEAGTLKNYKGSIELTKKDEDGKIIMSKVTFDLVRQKDQVTTSHETKDGVIFVEDLSPGTYYFQETSSVDSSYVLNNQKLEFTIPAEAEDEKNINIEREFKNYRGKATLNKQLENGTLTSINREAKFRFRIAGTNKYYAGVDKTTGIAEFVEIAGDIYDSTEVPETIKGTNSTGQLTLTGLAPGIYEWIEIEAPAGYLIDNTPTKVEIGPSLEGAAVVTTFTNYQGSAKLVKVDGNDQPIDLKDSGVQFEVYLKDKPENKVGIFTYGTDGSVVVNQLSPGVYTIKEVTAPNGYIVNPTGYDFTIPSTSTGIPEIISIKNSEEEDLRLRNYQGSAQLTKFAADGITTLEGAKFKVVKKNNQGNYEDVSTKPLTTNKDGIVTIADLAPGEYAFIETKAPEGYILNLQPVSFKISDKPTVSQPQTVTTKLANYQGSAQLTKFQFDEENPISGAEFKVVKKIDQENYEEVTTIPLVTDESGIVSILGLAPGEYAFIETKPAPGFVLDSTPQKFTVEATMGAGSSTIADITDKLKMTNAFTSFEFTKFIEEKQNLAQKALPGVQFTIKNKGKKHYNGGVGSATQWVDSFEEVSSSVQQSLKSDANGRVKVTGLAPGTYTVEEISAPVGTVIKQGSVLGVTIDVNGNVTFTGETDIINARELTNFSVTKTWDDESNAFGTRPGAIQFTLHRQSKSMEESEEVPGYENVVIEKPEETTNEWTHTFEGLVKYDDFGNEYQFSVEEELVTGYTRTDGGTELTKDTQKIINALDTVDIQGEKVWIDDENKYSTRPSNTQIEVELLLGEGDNAEPYLKNNQPVTTKLNLDGTYEFKGLPKTHPKTGEEVVYTVRDNVHGYVSSSNSEGTELTNTLQTINLSGTKTWENESTDTQNVRPEEVTVQLRYSDDAPVKDKDGKEITTTFNTTNGESYKFTNLPKYDSQGDPIIYKVKEIGAPGYSAVYSDFTKNSDGNYTIDITNTLIKSMRIPVTKTWVGDELDLVTRPESIKLYLDRIDSKGFITSEFKTLEYKATNKEENEWTGMEFTDLPTHDKYGKLFIYTIREEVPQGYAVSGTDTKITNADTSVQKITNTLLKPGEISFTKKWVDESDTSVRPDKIIFYLYRSVDGVEEKTPYKEQEVNITAGLEQSGIFENLPETDKNGKVYSYRVLEKQVAGYKEPSYSGETTKQVVTNTLNTISIPVVKDWKDKTDVGIRSDKVVVDLFRKTTTNKEFESKPFRTLELAPSNKWANEFTELAKMDKDGEEFIYSVRERKVPGYTTNITGSQAEGFKITNTLELTNVHVTKNWADFSNKFNLRPDDIHLQLMKRVDKELVPVEKETIKENGELETSKVEMTLSDKVKDKDQKLVVFSDLTKYDENGEEIHYVVTEKPVPGYRSSIVKTEGESHYQITNTLETINIPVTKVWEDTFKGKENYYQNRPKSITIRLKQGGKEIAQTSVYKEDAWSYVFKDLPKLDETGKPYEYEVTEDAVDKYNTKIDVNESNEVTITNTRKTYAIGDYTWIDSNKDGIQDEEEEILAGVIVELFDETGKIKIGETTTDGNGRYIFDELEDGKYTIKFTLTEEQSKKYEFTKQDSGENDKSDSDAIPETGWTVDFTLDENNKALVDSKDYTDQKFQATEGIDPTWDAGVILREKIKITGTKVWIGGPEVKPTIKLQLYRNGKPFGKSVELENGMTTYTWKDLYKTNPLEENPNQKPYVYTVKEVGTPSEYNKTEDGLKVTNTRKTYAIGDYTWIDTDKDGIQDKNEPVLPGVKVELFDENGKKIAETTTDKNGRYLFDELESGKYKVKFTLTNEQKKRYKFTKRHSGETAKDSNADNEGWTIDIDLNEKNAALTKDYQDQAFKASEGVDPTWDAGVILLDVPVKPTNPKDPKPNLPQMGEDGNPILLTSLGILLIGSVAGIVTTRRRRRS